MKRVKISKTAYNDNSFIETISAGEFASWAIAANADLPTFIGMVDLFESTGRLLRVTRSLIPASDAVDFKTLGGIVSEEAQWVERLCKLLPIVIDSKKTPLGWPSEVMKAIDNYRDLFVFVAIAVVGIRQMLIRSVTDFSEEILH